METTAPLAFFPQTHRYQQILAVALPISAAIISQSLLTLVDIAMVGRISTTCVAAFGLGNSCYFVVSSLLIGVNISVQALVSRREGEGNRPATGEALNSGLLLGLLAGGSCALVLVPSSKSIFSFLGATSEVAAEGVPYLAARLASLAPTGINFAFYGFWHGLKRPLAYLPSVLAMHLSNVFFNYVLIYGKFGLPRFGTLGAGLGSLLATILGALCLAVITWHLAPGRNVYKRWPEWKIISSLWRMVAVNGLQQGFLASAILCFLWIISKIGVAELAIATVLVNLSLFSLLPCVGIGHASGAFVGQALGAGHPDEARAWGVAAIKAAVSWAAILLLALVVAPRFVMSIFITDPEIVRQSLIPTFLTAGVFIIEGASVVLVYSLIGAAYYVPVMITVLATLWGGLIPISWLMGPYWGGGLPAVWTVLMVCRIVQTGALAWMWSGDRWQKVKI